MVAIVALLFCGRRSRNRAFASTRRSPPAPQAPGHRKGGNYCVFRHVTETSAITRTTHLHGDPTGNASSLLTDNFIRPCNFIVLPSGRWDLVHAGPVAAPAVLSSRAVHHLPCSFDSSFSVNEREITAQ